jgi:hypothetical protein
MEYASIAAFARFTLELVSFGAPADLVLRAQEAGLDEIRHAAACFAMAERFGQDSMGPAPMPVHDAGPSSSLRASVLCALTEGCVGETLAAARAQAAGKTASCPEIRALLRQIADDEARHAELAWRYVAWALRCDPSLRGPIQEGFASALRALGARSTEAVNDPDGLTAEERALERAHGRLSSDEEREIARVTARDVIGPCAAALLAAPLKTVAA